MEQIQEVISGFGAMVGLPDLVLDESNCCTLQFDQVVVNAEYLSDSNEFYFYSKIGPIPANSEDRLRVFAGLLESNCFYRRTSGGVLGIDEALDAIIYTNKVGADGLNANMFGDYMEAFVNLAEDFGRGVLDDSGGNGDARDDGPQDLPNMGMRV